MTDLDWKLCDQGNGVYHYSVVSPLVVIPEPEPEAPELTIRPGHLRRLTDLHRLTTALPS